MRRTVAWVCFVFSLTIGSQALPASQGTVDGLVGEIRAIAGSPGSACDRVATQYPLAQAIKVIAARHDAIQPRVNLDQIARAHALCFGPATPPGVRPLHGGGVFGGSRVPDIAAAMAFMPKAHRERLTEVLPEGTLDDLSAWRKANPATAAALDEAADSSLSEIASEEKIELFGSLGKAGTTLNANVRRSLELQVEEIVGVDKPQ